MKTIYKYILKIDDTQYIETYEFAQILKVGYQHNNLCLWALVNTDCEKIFRHLAIVGTGNPIKFTNEIKHINTVFDPNGLLVWHIFDLGEGPEYWGKRFNN